MRLLSIKRVTINVKTTQRYTQTLKMSHPLNKNSCFDEFNTFIIQKCVIYINAFLLGKLT